LYGQRVGALSVVTGNETEAQNVLSQMKITIRSSYSNPPRHGARVVSTILSDPKLTTEFIDQCNGMANRINDMRIALRTNLEQGDGGNAHARSWEHITKQIGMFAYSGLTKEECENLRDTHHIYCTLNGRISMAGVTSGNVDYIADAILDVTKRS
jgi:aspartate aminotransferase